MQGNYRHQEFRHENPEAYQCQGGQSERVNNRPQHHGGLWLVGRIEQDAMSELSERIIRSTRGSIDERVTMGKLDDERVGNVLGGYDGNS